MHDDKPLWTKSYLVRTSKKHATCDAKVFGFEPLTSVYELIVDEDAYLMPDNKTFALATGIKQYKKGTPPLSTDYLIFNVEDGNSLYAVPRNMRFVDAEWLRKIKQKLSNSLLVQFPDITYKEVKAIPSKERQARQIYLEKTRTEKLFSGIETTLFGASTDSTKP